ncbi:MAG: hypothetical protein JWO56_1462 [Acidobacteria bacterium]|nr:hypothetical protein [Acidobacteriota bacterium]
MTAASEGVSATRVIPRRHDLLAIGALCLLASICFADVLAGVNNFYMRDLTRYYYPTKQILREVVQHGEFPYWNRYFSAGQPIAANPEHEVFYPLTWLILLPSYDFGYRLHILIHIYIGLLGMYALLRSMDASAEAAFMGAMAFGLGGLYLSYINLLPIMFCAAWLPLTCLFVRRFLLRHTLRDFGLAALFLGIQFVIGEPTTVMQTGFLIGMYALYRGWYSRPRLAKSVTRVLWIALISACGILVGAAQLFPAVDHVHDSARSRPFDFDLVTAWSMPWAKFAEVIYPNILGHISIKQVMWYWGGGLYPGMGSPFIFSIYVGLLTIALAIGGAFIRPRGGRFVLLLVAVSSLLALGGQTPLYRFLYKAGIATSIRYPEKFILIGVFALILFSAQMLDRLLDGDDALRDGALGFLFASVAVAAVLGALGFTGIYVRTFMKVWGYTMNGNTARMIELTRNDWIIAAIRGTVYAALLWNIRRFRRPVWFTALAVVAAIDLGIVTYELNPRMPRHFFDPPPIAATFPKDRAAFRVFHEVDWYGQEDPARQYFSTGDAVYWIVRNGLFPMTPAGSKLRTVMERDYDKTALIPTIDFTDSVWDVKRSGTPDWREKFLAMSNAWYTGLYRDFKAESKRVKGNFKIAAPVRFEETTHYPRYYFADQIVTVANRAEFVKLLSKYNYRSAVAFIRAPGFTPAPGRVLKVTETANTARLEVESRGQGFLVMSVTPHKYWMVEIDGRSVTPIVANVGYQGLIVTPGRHVIAMRYRNELVRVGGAVSIFAAIMLVGMVILPRRPRPYAGLPAYEETLHVVADADGTHLEPVEIAGAGAVAAGETEPGGIAAMSNEQ